MTKVKIVRMFVNKVFSNNSALRKTTAADALLTPTSKILNLNLTSSYKTTSLIDPAKNERMYMIKTFGVAKATTAARPAKNPIL